MIDDASREHVLELMEDARAKGATVLTGGEDLGNNVLSPAVVAGVTPEMRLYAEESFGPVVAIIDADGEDDAVPVANDTTYGLSATSRHRAGGGSAVTSPSPSSPTFAG